MKTSIKNTLTLTALLSAIVSPAFAGNYAEGDPRPTPLVSSANRADVKAETQRWLKTAPTQGYPDGDPREAISVSANTRAMVRADTMAWIRSGMAAVTNGEAGADMSSPAYRKAAAEYERLRSAQGIPQQELTPGTPATQRR